MPLQCVSTRFFHAARKVTPSIDAKLENDVGLQRGVSSWDVFRRRFNPNIEVLELDGD
jgi:hypothetical protein